MAKVEVTKEYIECDRPGCGKKVTDKGGIMYTIGHALHFAARGDALPGEMDHADADDLCRECFGQMQSAWNRKVEE